MKQNFNMKAVLLILMIFNSTYASQLVSLDEIDKVIAKLLRNELSEDDNNMLKDLVEILYRTDFSSTQPENIPESRMSIECFLCRSLFATAIEDIRNGQTDEGIIKVLTSLCISLGIVSENVCRGAIALNVPIFAYIARTVPEASGATFCGLIFQVEGNPNACPYNDPRFEWQVELPAPISAEVEPVVETSLLTIAIITDAHLDPLYEAYGVADCDEPTCCRKGQRPARHRVYHSNVIDSIVEKSLLNTSAGIVIDMSVVPEIKHTRKLLEMQESRSPEPAGYWGDYRRCDSPIWAFDDVIERIAETHKDIDILYYIGDTIDHGVWETSYELVNDMNRYFIEKIRKSFGDNVLVIPVIGNHESQPTNQFAPSSVTADKLNTTWLYEALADKWGFYLTEEAKLTLREQGEFSMLIKPGLRVITLNTNVAYKYNWWTVYDTYDAKKHLDWLIQELYKAEIAGEKVHILTHLPPGVEDLTHTWTREYNRIINRFSSTIKAEFNGHVHSDEFKVFYNLEGAPINVAWGVGSATSYTFYNLNYKIATIGSSFEPLNIVNYVYNLTEANLTPNRRPHWFQLYNMRNTFALPDLSAASMDNLVYRMVTTDTQLLDIYAAFFSKLSDSRWPNCDINCKLNSLCRTVVTVLWERQKCEELRSLYFQ